MNNFTPTGMLSEREIDQLEASMEGLEYVQVETRLIAELIEFWRQKHPPKQAPNISIFKPRSSDE